MQGKEGRISSTGHSPSGEVVWGWGGAPGRGGRGGGHLQAAGCIGLRRGDALQLPLPSKVCQPAQAAHVRQQRPAPLLPQGRLQVSALRTICSSARQVIGPSIETVMLFVG